MMNNSIFLFVVLVKNLKMIMHLFDLISNRQHILVVIQLKKIQIIILGIFFLFIYSRLNWQYFDNKKK